jgi:hypothetical protein
LPKDHAHARDNANELSTLVTVPLGTVPMNIIGTTLGRPAIRHGGMAAGTTGLWYGKAGGGP